MRGLFRILTAFSFSILFSGTGISQIQVKPLPIDASLVNEGNSEYLDGPSILKLKDFFVWGGSVVKGKDGKYHMLFSLWESGPDKADFVTSWVLESKIGYAVSDFPDRDFKFQKIILKGTRFEGDATSWDAQMVHNPHLKEFEGRYYLYYIGSKDPGEAIAPDLDKRTRVQQSQKIGVLGFDSFEDLIAGNFERAKEPLLIPRTRVKANHVVSPSPQGTIAKPDNLVMVNPSVDYHPETREYMLFFKGNIYEPGWKGVHGVATGPTPMGPFIPKDDFIFDIRMPDGTLASAEDPYVWYSSKYSSFFAIVKDFTGAFTDGEKKSLAILKSKDGIKWETLDHSLFMKREVLVNNGSKIQLDRLERPQLLLSEEGIPIFLYCAASVANVNQKKDGSSFNVQIPLK
ncbi:glycoside hydrolase family protein [Algoriphagus aestuarii]|nr:glycoside hydrolase family protein [Algoriphagus aestuarii]